MRLQREEPRGQRHDLSDGDQRYALRASRALHATTSRAMRWNRGECCSGGKFYVNVTIGGQLFRLSPDTGSALLAVPSSTCASCSPSLHRYSPPSHAWLPCNESEPLLCSACVNSSTPGERTCATAVTYIDGSGFTAALVNDALLGTRVTFGAIVDEVERGGIAFEPPNVDGIWGMASSGESLVGMPTAFDQLVAAGAIVQRVFAICMGLRAGALELGGDGATLASDALQYTPTSPSSSPYWAVRVLSVSVLGQPLPLPSSSYTAHDAIVDSGTADLILPAWAHLMLKTTLAATCLDARGGEAQEPLLGVCTDVTGVSGTLFEGYCFNMTDEQVPCLRFDAWHRRRGCA